MIINWKKEKAGALVIPCVSNKKVTKHLVLVPGHNQVSEKDYERAKDGLAKYIKAGTMETVTEEVEVKVAKPSRKGKEPKVITTTENKEVVDLSKVKKSKKAVKIVKDTYDIPTLEAWQEAEGRDEVRAAIANQIITVNSPPQK